MTIDFTKLVEEFETVRAELMKKAQAVVNEKFQELLNAHPEITMITWNQYCPYFNDGETCEFSINDWYVSNAPYDDFENVSSYGEYEGGTEDIFVKGSWDDKSKKYKDVWDFEKFANSTLGHDVFLSAFGDGVEVRVTKDSITIDDYDHD